MITIRPAAAQELKRLMTKRPEQQRSQIRLQLVQGSCAEWTYVLGIDSTTQPEDAIFDCDGITIAISNIHLPYLQGLTIDYSEDLMGGGFRFINPQASQTCGCGNSFSLNQDTHSLLPEDCVSYMTSVPSAKN